MACGGIRTIWQHAGYVQEPIYLLRLHKENLRNVIDKVVRLLTCQVSAIILINISVTHYHWYHQSITYTPPRSFPMTRVTTGQPPWIDKSSSPQHESSGQEADMLGDALGKTPMFPFNKQSWRDKNRLTPIWCIPPIYPFQTPLVPWVEMMLLEKL